MRTRRLPAMLITVAMLGVACGDDDGTGDTSAPATTVTTTPVTTTPATTSPDTTSPATTTMAVPALAQPAIWPADDVVFATPEEAAADFVANVFGIEPVLGEYMSGDSRSGEIEVFSPGETVPVSRSTLMLRMLGPSDGWFVIAAANSSVTINSPEVNTEVPAGELTVEGVARGFEGTVVVTAFQAGDSEAVLDQVITSGGSRETSEPYSVTVDLTGAAEGEMVTLLVRGDTGLETDPGEFSAIPVVVAAAAS